MIPRAGDLLITRQGARFMGREIACSIGRGGIARKRREGDNISPTGAWRITGVLYRPDRTAAPETMLDTQPIMLTDKWSDDPNDSLYNNRLSAREHPFSYEALRRADPLYDLVATTDFNAGGAIRGGGSAIFLHVWRAPRFPTAGCIAFGVDDLRFILARWRDRARVVIKG